MHEYKARISWKGNSDLHEKGTYSRLHEWSFDAGITIPASASPKIVPLPFSTESAVDPEEAFIASVSSCHMLTFLWEARKLKISIEEYVDDAIGVMEKDAAGTEWVTRVNLNISIKIKSDSSDEDIDKAHKLAHMQCYIANSIKSQVFINTTITRSQK